MENRSLSVEQSLQESNKLGIPKKLSRKVMIIGTGKVGMSCAYAIMIQHICEEMILVDIDQEKLTGELMDLVHGMPFVEAMNIHSGTIADGQDADIIIITAGAKRNLGETRLNLVNRNTEIFKQVIPEIIKYCAQSILLIVSNPVDIMTYISIKLSGLPSSMIIGSGTILDTARFRYLLSQKLQINPQSIHAYIIGEHGDSEVPVWSRANIGGMNIIDSDQLDSLPEDLVDIFHQVKNAGAEIIKRKGATSYAIALGVTEIVQSILHNQNRVFTVSTLINNVYGINDVCLSLPAVINNQGITNILPIDLTEKEQLNLQHSAKTLQEIIHQIKLY